MVQVKKVRLVIVCDHCSWIGTDKEVGPEVWDTKAYVLCRRCCAGLALYRPRDAGQFQRMNEAVRMLLKIPL